MATSKIKFGQFTRPITKALDDKNAVIDAATRIATQNNLDVLVMQQHDGRWQAWARRNNARGASYLGDYNFLPCGRRAKKRNTIVDGGRVQIID